MGTDGPIIDLKEVSFGYAGGERIIDALSFRLNRGDRIGLIGPNGCGKTTLFHLIMGLLKPTGGSIEIFGKPVRTEKDFIGIRRRIGLLFQDADDQLFCPTVLEDVAFGPLNQGKSRQEAVEIARKTLEYLGLSGFEDRISYKLSGGEKRLVSLATVLAMQPEVLLFDEPTTGLDEKTKGVLAQVLSGLEISYILISHEIDYLGKISDSIYAMQNGRILTERKVQVHQHVHAHNLGAVPHEHE
jgi:cobalt/nickel transport system ATP-binding protein